MQGKNEQYYKAYLNYNRISRRGLLRGVFHPLERAKRSGESRLAPRPPFAAEENLFLAACNGCGECVDACPYNLIRVSGQKAVLELDYAAAIYAENVRKVVRRTRCIPLLKKIRNFARTFRKIVC